MRIRALHRAELSLNLSSRNEIGSVPFPVLLARNPIEMPVLTGGRPLLLGGGLAFIRCAEAAADLADGLPQPIFVFDQCHSQIAFAGRTEAAAGADGHVPSSNSLVANSSEFNLPYQGARDFRPQEHAGPGRIHFPADSPQAVAQHVAAALIVGGLRFDVGIRLAAAP